MVGYAKGFNQPTDNDKKKALGNFPCKRMTNNSIGNDQNLFTNNQNTWKPIPAINSEGDWLANNSEPGQTLDQYISEQQSAKNLSCSKTDKKTNARIHFLPIIKENTVWPEAAPSLQLLKSWISAFFQIEVILLEPAKISIKLPTTMPETENETIKGPIIEFNSAFQTNKSNLNRGRYHTTTKHFQIYIEGLLEELKLLVKKNKELRQTFCLVGITVEDLISGSERHNGLFTAGLATETQVCVLSLFRYHPQLVMSTDIWHSYYHVNKCSDFPVEFDGIKKKAATTRGQYDDPNRKGIDSKYRTEFLRRTAKLIAHEVMHVLGFHHCIYYHCLMNGTGHLGEDFKAPAHICGVCLRKLQYKLGFDVIIRYQELLNFFDNENIKKEYHWYNKRLTDLQVNSSTDKIENIIDVTDETKENKETKKQKIY